ncbi:MAG: nucleotidyltransferase domain-containing protein [Deltaproteobacteria bacterium]|nr:nucleotidyltransferase domain-containing protein [Deltaproteobacteria bacterium]
MALSKDEVIKIVKGFLESLRRKHDVREAYLFGSFATGKAKDYSDVDLAIVLGSLDAPKDSLFDEEFQIFHEAQKYNSRLEVVCFLQKEFDQNGCALVKRIKKEGIRLV